jgi:catecholate siderophore receptor
LATSLEADDQLVGWKLGGVYKPAVNGSIYVSYATSQLPPGGANFSLSSTAANANNPNVDPQKGTNQEVGTKWNVYGDKLALTAAVFRSTNDNEFATQPDGTTLAVGERRVQGVELGASGIVMQNWQVNAGLAYMDPEITRGNRSTANNGASQTDGGVIQWSPKLTFTAWNSYTFKSGLVLGGGARYVDSVASTSLTSAAALATRSMVEVPDYWVVDAMASYPVSKNVNLQLNLFNLLDEKYIAALNSGVSRYYPGVERSARLGVNLSF